MDLDERLMAKDSYVGWTHEVFQREADKTLVLGNSKMRDSNIEGD